MASTAMAMPRKDGASTAPRASIRTLAGLQIGLRGAAKILKDSGGKVTRSHSRVARRAAAFKETAQGELWTWTTAAPVGLQL